MPLTFVSASFVPLVFPSESLALAAASAKSLPLGVLFASESFVPAVLFASESLPPRICPSFGASGRRASGRSAAAS